MRRSLSAALLLLLPLAACGAKEEPPELGKRSQPIAGGTPDSENRQVVGMFSLSGQSGGMCTGTLIAPNLILTARHCVSPSLSTTKHVICGQSGFGNPYPGSNIYVTTDAQLSQQGKWYQGREVRVPKEGNDTCGFDIALVILAQRVKDVTPATPRIDKPVEIGELYTAIGFGQTEFGSGGRRMLRSNLKVACEGSTCTTFPGVQSTEWGGETGICQGDSGGPALDENGMVIGVVSRGIQGCNLPTYGSVNRMARLDCGNRLGCSKTRWLRSSNLAVTKKTSEPPIKKPDPQKPSPKDAQGQSCGAGLSCPAGYSCVTTGTADEAICAKQCSTDEVCNTGLSCTEQNFCFGEATPSSDSSGGGCVVSDGGPARGPARPVPWIFSALCLGIGWLRRRQKTARDR